MSNNGFIAGGFVAQDRPYSYLGGPHSKQDFQYVNLWEDHKNWLTPVYNQYDSGSCVANATAALIRYATYMSIKGNINEALTNPLRAFIYYYAQALEYVSPDTFAAGVAGGGERRGQSNTKRHEGTQSGRDSAGEGLAVGGKFGAATG
jgi:hypothetical protein